MNILMILVVVTIFTRVFVECLREWMPPMSIFPYYEYWKLTLPMFEWLRLASVHSLSPIDWAFCHFFLQYAYCLIITSSFECFCGNQRSDDKLHLLECFFFNIGHKELTEFLIKTIKLTQIPPILKTNDHILE